MVQFVFFFCNLSFPEPGEHELCIPCPDSVSGDTLGDIPRERYPVVVLTFVPEPQLRAAGHGEVYNQRQDEGVQGHDLDSAAGAKPDFDELNNVEDANCIVSFEFIIPLY